MYEVQDTKCNNMEDFYEIVRPMSKGLASALKNFFCAPSDKELYCRIKVYSMGLKHEERMKIMDCVLELAKLNQLSDERFRLLMIAFSN